MRRDPRIGTRTCGIRIAVAVVLCLASMVVGAVAREILIPEETTMQGDVAIAEWFYRTDVEGNTIARELQVWFREDGLREPDYFDTLILASPGDVIVLSPGSYTADLWIYSPGITITTAQDPDSDEIVRASIWGTVEIDADRVVLDGIEVTGPRKHLSSGHGIVVNREVARLVTIRNCRSVDNDWTGIHMIGARGQMAEMRVENCELSGNGMDGLDAQNIDSVIITGCTVTGNGVAGLRINRYINNLVLENNIVTGNRAGDITGSGI